LKLLGKPVDTKEPPVEAMLFDQGTRDATQPNAMRKANIPMITSLTHSGSRSGCPGSLGYIRSIRPSISRLSHFMLGVYSESCGWEGAVYYPVVAELTKPIADYLEKNPEQVREPERRIMERIIEKNLIYMSEAELQQARYLLVNARKPA